MSHHSLFAVIQSRGFSIVFFAVRMPCQSGQEGEGRAGKLGSSDEKGDQLRMGVHMSSRHKKRTSDAKTDDVDKFPMVQLLNDLHSFWGQVESVSCPWSCSLLEVVQLPFECLIVRAYGLL